jgi:hypothetical protein
LLNAPHKMTCYGTELCWAQHAQLHNMREVVFPLTDTFSPRKE